MTWRDTAIRVLFALLALLFSWAALLQLNDPDPFLWVGLYGLAAALCGAAVAAVRLPVWIGSVLAAITLGWAGWEAWIVWGPAEATPMFHPESGQPGRSAPDGLMALEEAREMFGLLFIAAAGLLHAWWMRRLEQLRA